MKSLRFFMTFTLVLMVLGSGAWTHISQANVSDSLLQAGLSATDWQAIQTQVAKVTAVNDGSFVREFGRAVAMDGDTVVVGAYNSAYVLYRNQGGPDAWGQVAKLTTVDAEAREYGYSVSVNGDTIVVGAPDAFIGSNTYQGAAYVYYRNRGGPDAWGQVAKLTEAGASGGDHFATSVSVSGDTILVGVPYDDIGVNTDQGSAIVFQRDQSGPDAWGQVTKLFAGDGNDGYWFGYSVSISGDTALVGSNNAWNDTYRQWMGAAYLFNRDKPDPNAWGLVTKLPAPESTVVRFGQAVSISGDTALVGAYATDIDDNFDQGAAYLYERDQEGSDVWNLVTRLTANDGAAEDRFGWSVSISGETAVVGADSASIEGRITQGTAYVFSRNQNGEGTWDQAAKLIASDGMESDRLGWSVAISGNTVVGGALYVDYGDNTDQGAAYLFYGEPSVVAPSGVIVSGATQGAINTGYPFTAIVNPDNATLPITYDWQASGQLPVTQTGGLIDTVTFAWTTGGTKDITVTATNAGGQVIGTHSLQIYLESFHVSEMAIRYKAFQGGRYDVFVNVVVLDQNNQPVRKASVLALWTLPDGYQLAKEATSVDGGKARFKVTSTQVGTYNFCVIDVVKLGWFYNSSQNSETCGVLAVP